MTTRRLGHTDMELSPIGLGSWQFSQGKGYTGGMWAVLEQPMIDAVVAAALAGGIDWIDSAEAYGNGQSEHALSSALHHLKVHPSAVTLATKWLPIPRTAANIPRTIDTRLRCLQGYPIGLYQVHFPGSLSSIRAQMGEMAKLVRAGKIGSVGVSNFSARRMEEASAALRAEGLSLASNQVPISLLDRRIENSGVLESARRLGVTLIAYSPLAQGLLTGKFHESAELVAALPSAAPVSSHPGRPGVQRREPGAHAPALGGVALDRQGARRLGDPGRSGLGDHVLRRDRSGHPRRHLTRSRPRERRRHGVESDQSRTGAAGEGFGAGGPTLVPESPASVSEHVG